MTHIQFEPLKNHPQFVKTIMQSCYEEFNYCFPELTPEYFEKSVNEKLHTDKLPIFFVALDGKELIGCFALRHREESVEKDFSPPLKKKFSPWLGSVIVLPKYRGRGFGRLLVETAKEKTKEFGFKELYLFTDKEEFYKKIGFKIIQKITVHNRPFTVMGCQT